MVMICSDNASKPKYEMGGLEIPKHNFASGVGPL